MRVLGGRPLPFVLRNAVAPRNYVALANMLRRYPRPLDALGRYFLGRGEYPYDCPVRTPAGVVRPRLSSFHDMLTVNEVFCREDYRAGPSLRVAVDIGSNIGISALYFLTRTPASRCYLYEPDPRNVARLKENLRGYEGRVEVHEEAVADRAGTLPFGIEPHGRYGGLDVETGETIDVRCRHVDDVLEDVLAREAAIDVLKIDTEGSELATVGAIRPDLLARVRTLYFESEGGTLVEPPGFRASVACDTVRLQNGAMFGREAAGTLR